MAKITVQFGAGNQVERNVEDVDALMSDTVLAQFLGYDINRVTFSVDGTVLEAGDDLNEGDTVVVATKANEKAG